MSISHRSFRDASRPPLEVLILLLTVVPIVVLVYFFPLLPNQVPEYLNLRGEVEVWGAKSFASVFRLPMMALDLQLLCLLAKYATWQRSTAADSISTSDSHRAFSVTLNLFDWFRAFIAGKLASSSLEVIIFSIERYQYLTTLTRAISWSSSIIGVVGAIIYGYQLLIVQRRMKPLSASQSTSRFFYFNPADPMWLNQTNAPNFGNKWIYVFLLCLIVLPFLMFWPMMSR